ncbi:hypothetical protein [Kyrpidia tusciae]|uniref:Uncharacterized protein n=1 Tax=Kyrpidia tusciae (strain DSM 2912 / NBRC 15312 / T2) TaxID=562970 RepID=D5WVA4_KYRT2|nr:hypothetical protein [Kyrpidia tusciae]ADG05514.1 hypothetical protein Btus_0754 [Kyrpidia tusciae DSM 2912]MBE3551646.1 hypothetical protein [Kyrpidia tusciae]
MVRKVSLIVTVILVAIAVGYFIRDVRTWQWEQSLSPDMRRLYYFDDIRPVDLKASAIHTAAFIAAVSLFEWLFLMALPPDSEGKDRE